MPCFDLGGPREWRRRVGKANAGSRLGTTGMRLGRSRCAPASEGQNAWGDLTTKGGASSAGLLRLPPSWEGDGVRRDHCGRVRGGHFEFLVTLRVAAGATLLGVSRGH